MAESDDGGNGVGSGLIGHCDNGLVLCDHLLGKCPHGWFC